jgi:hypothetical protein
MARDRVSKVTLPIEHQWLLFWNGIGLADPSLFEHAIAVLETLVAIALILGLFTNARPLRQESNPAVVRVGGLDDLIIGERRG